MAVELCCFRPATKIVACAGSYAFAFPRRSDGVWMHYLLPLLGSINHAGPEAANARVRWDHAAGAFQAVALRDITQGEEVLIMPLHLMALHAPFELADTSLKTTGDTLLQPVAAAQRRVPDEVRLHPAALPAAPVRGGPAGRGAGRDAGGAPLGALGR